MSIFGVSKKPAQCPIALLQYKCATQGTISIAMKLINKKNSVNLSHCKVYAI